MFSVGNIFAVCQLGGIGLSMCCVRGSSSEENQPWLHCMSHYPLPIWLHFDPCFNLLECFVLFQPEELM